jgi:hypothetical protein
MVPYFHVLYCSKSLNTWVHVALVVKWKQFCIVFEYYTSMYCALYDELVCRTNFNMQ